MFMSISGASANLHDRKGGGGAGGKGKKKGKEGHQPRYHLDQRGDSEMLPQITPEDPSRVVSASRPKSAPNTRKGQKAQNQKLPEVSPAKNLAASSSSPTTKASAKIIGANAAAAAGIPLVGVPLRQQSVFEIAEERLKEARRETESGHVVIVFNHYQKQFPIHNTVLKWADVDEEYSLSFVYKGNYKRELQLIPAQHLASNPNNQHGSSFQNIKAFLTKAFHASFGQSQSNLNSASKEATANASSLGGDTSNGLTVIPPPSLVGSSGLSVHHPIVTLAKHDDEHTYFIDLKPGDQYLLHIEEDPQAGITTELRTSSQPLNASDLANIAMSGGSTKDGSDGVKQPNAAFNQLTSELKALAPTELGGQQAKDLLERRDLEDILYSNS